MVINVIRNGPGDNNARYRDVGRIAIFKNNTFSDFLPKEEWPELGDQGKEGQTESVGVGEEMVDEIGDDESDISMEEDGDWNTIFREQMVNVAEEILAKRKELKNGKKPIRRGIQDLI